MTNLLSNKKHAPVSVVLLSIAQEQIFVSCRGNNPKNFLKIKNAEGQSFRIALRSSSLQLIRAVFPYHFISPSPAMRRVISSMRSMGNGGALSGRMAMLMSFIGLSSAATRLDESAPQRRQR